MRNVAKERLIEKFGFGYKNPISSLTRFGFGYENSKPIHVMPDDDR
jgi:hypothetical protein